MKNLLYAVAAFVVYKSLQPMQPEVQTPIAPIAPGTITPPVVFPEDLPSSPIATF